MIAVRKLALSQEVLVEPDTLILPVPHQMRREIALVEHLGGDRRLIFWTGCQHQITEGCLGAGVPAQLLPLRQAAALGWLQVLLEDGPLWYVAQILPAPTSPVQPLYLGEVQGA